MSSLPEFHVVVEGQHQGMRLDKYLAHQLPQFSRSRLQSFLAQGHVFSQGACITTPNHRIREDERYTLIPPAPEPALMQPQDLSLHIHHEDEDILVVEKPAGLVVHPGPGHREGTVAHGLLAHCGKDLSTLSGESKPGIVHRLDKDTSGLLVVAKNDYAHCHLSQQFAQRTLEKRYWAFVWKHPFPASGRIHTFLGPHAKHPLKRAVVSAEHRNAKEAITLYRTVATFGGSTADGVPAFSLLNCSIKTGRTHQIRVHCAHLGHPLVGEKLYGEYCPEKTPLLPSRHGLHAYSLVLEHPRTRAHLQFSSVLPADLVPLWHLLGSPPLGPAS